jgi:excisionase family DNA binding protein
MGELLTVEELAQRLRLRPSTIRRWAQENIIPALRLSGKVIRFDLDEVLTALRSKSSNKEPQPAAN